MILVDANLLIYAVDADSSHHAVARRWLETALSGPGWVGLPWIVVLAFVRVTTRSGILRRPLRVEQAIGYVDEWLAQPCVRLVTPGDRHWSILRGLLEGCGTAGNLTSDAHLAALAIEHGCVIASTDNDFKRFSGVGLHNPLGGAGGKCYRRSLDHPGISLLHQAGGFAPQPPPTSCCCCSASSVAPFDDARRRS